MLINFGRQARTAGLPRAMRDVLGPGQTIRPVELWRFGVALLQPVS